VILLLGDFDDVLLNTVSRLFVSRGQAVKSISDAELFSKVPFAFEQCGEKFSGSILLDGQEIQLDDLSGVLIRLSRRWSPPPDFDLQDQVFIYHENGASWFALLKGLRCPAVNRPALATWVQDLTYPETVARSLARALEVGLSDQFASAASFACTFPTAPPEQSSSTSFYAVQGKLIPRSGGMETLADRLEGQALREWQQEQGISLCRLDFECEKDVPKLARVETHPLLNHEPAAVVEQVASAITEVLA